MAELTFLRDLAVVMAVSALTTILFHVFRQPVVLGYLVAGMLIGPYTTPFSLVADRHSIHTLAELGIVLLLFSLGLEFNLKKLRRVGAVAVVAAVLGILSLLWLGYTTGQLLGWGQMDSLFLGALLSISSTTITVQVLMETGQLRELFAQIILGILIVEDVAAILILVVLSGLANAGTITVIDVGWALLRATMFIATALVIGLFMAPRLLAFVAAFRRGEMLTVTALGLAFGLAVLGAHFGFSVALGAFLMGAIMAETSAADEIAARITPIREMFTAVFFVATGMLLDPARMVELWQVILIVTVLTVIGKVLSNGFGVFLAGYPAEVALPVGLGKAQIGEFSFIIANLGRTTAVTSGALYPIAVAVSAVTTLLMPYLLRAAPAIAAGLTRVSPGPLLTFTTFYTAWVTRVAARAPRTERVVQGLFFRLLLYLAVAVSVYVVTWSAIRPLVAALPVVLPRQREILQWGGAAVVVLPFLFLFGRTVSALVQTITSALLQRPGEGAATQTRLVRDTLLFLFGWVAAVFVLAVGSPVLPPLVPLAIVGLGLLLPTYLFWGSLTRFHAHIEDVLDTLSEGDSDADMRALLPQRESRAEQRERKELRQLLSERYGLAAQIEDFVIPFHPTVLNRSVREIGLRRLTGASIIAIYRDSEHLIVPQAETVLLPGDVLALLGDRDQLEAAFRVLTEMAVQKMSTTLSPPQMAAVTIVCGSSFAGRTLAQLGLREELEVLIVEARRGTEHIANPGPDFQVENGDTLFFWGPSDHVEEARRRAAPIAGNNGE